MNGQSVGCEHKKIDCKLWCHPSILLFVSDTVSSCFELIPNLNGKNCRSIADSATRPASTSDVGAFEIRYDVINFFIRWHLLNEQIICVNNVINRYVRESCQASDETS